MEPANAPEAKKNSKTSSMTEALHRFRIATFFILLFEITILGLGIAFYFLDIPSGFKALMKTEYWMIAFGAIIVINLILLWLFEIRIGKIRQKNDVAAASIIGTDIQEAYNFGQLGLVVTDETNVVMWVNSFFKGRIKNILDQNIFAWQPKLKDLQGRPDGTVANLEIDGSHYAVEYLSDAHLFIFRDVTKYTDMVEYSAKQEICIGIIMIDNYAEIAGNAEDENNDVISDVRQIITDYGAQFHLLLRRYKNDSYFLVAKNEDLARLRLDGFTVLEKVKAAGKGESVVPTLSIGIAHDSGTLSSLNDMASKALDTAMSRGGDQAVISELDKPLEFYGGKTAAIESTGRVQFRTDADTLIRLIKASSSVIVSGHKIADMDALGACLGVKALCDWYKVPCHIVFDPKITEEKTRFAFQGSFNRAELDAMTYSPREAADRMSPNTLLVVVDISVPNQVMAEAAVDKAAKIAVIDHHRRGDLTIQNPVFSHIDPSAGSTCEILAEFTHYATANPAIQIPPLYATIMLSGMMLDTNFFKSKSTGIRSFEAAEILKEFGADSGQADEFLKDAFEEFALVTNIISTTKTPYTGIVYCQAPEDQKVTNATLSKAGNQLMQLRGINACFVFGYTDHGIHLSARSNGTINVQLLCEKLGGGGHFGMAAAHFDDKSTTLKDVEAKLLDDLSMHLSEAKSHQGEGDNQQ